MALDVLGLGLANSYTDETVEGGGAIKGKNCTVDDISKSGKKNTVRFKWTLDDGTVLTGNMEVLDGEDGAPGTPGANGKDGKDGADGDPGPAGKGIASIEQVTGESQILITYDDGTEADPIDIPTVAGQPGANGKDGKDGKDGTNGTNGTDGVSPTVTVKTSTSDTYVLTITDASGSLDTPNLKGADGQDGTDGKDGQDGVGVPSGGTTGQVLAKKTNSDYDTEWVNAGGGSGEHIQYDTMPTAEQSIEGKIVQYTGPTNALYTNGYFYICEYDASGYIIATPVMTSNTTPSGVCSASTKYGSREPYYMFRQNTDPNTDIDEQWSTDFNGSVDVWVQYKFDTAKIITKVDTYNRTDGEYAPKNMTLKGSNDGTNWTNIASFINTTEVGAARSQFKIDNENAYIYYRLQIDSFYHSGHAVSFLCVNLFTGNDGYVWNRSDVQPSSGGSGGHTIVNQAGTSLTARANLQFIDATPTDDSTNNVTKVEVVKEITKSQLASMPDGLYAVTDEDTVLGSDYHTYSTTEHVVGQWVDGSNIYEKVIESTTPNASGIIPDTLITSLSFLVQATEIITDSSNNIECLHGSYGEYLYFYYIPASGLYVSYAPGSEASWAKNRPIKVILRYTKTTD